MDQPKMDQRKVSKTGMENGPPFEILPFGIQMNILEKFTFQQFATFNECSKYTNSHSIRKKKNIMFDKKVEDLFFEKNTFTTRVQVRFTAKSIFCRVPVTDKGCHQLMKHVKSSEKMYLEAGISCSPEMLSAVIEKLHIQKLLFHGIFEDAFKYGNCFVEKLYIYKTGLSLKTILSVKAQNVFVDSHHSAEEVVQEMKKWALSSTLPSQSKSGNLVRSFIGPRFTIEAVKNAIDRLGAETIFIFKNETEALWTLVINSAMLDETLANGHCRVECMGWTTMISPEDVEKSKCACYAGAPVDIKEFLKYAIKSAGCPSCVYKSDLYNEFLMALRLPRKTQTAHVKCFNRELIDYPATVHTSATGTGYLSLKNRTSSMLTIQFGCDYHTFDKDIIKLAAEEETEVYEDLVFGIPDSRDTKSIKEKGLVLLID